MRRDKINYYLDVAETIASRSTCLNVNQGAIVVKNDEVIATGYSGSPRGRKNCSDIGYCVRAVRNVPDNTQFELCRKVCAETNCIIEAARKDLIGSTMFLVSFDDNGYKELVPCSQCQNFIINAGINSVIIRYSKDMYREFITKE